MIHFLYLILIFPLLVSCQSDNKCRNDLEFLKVRNSNYQYNCGIEFLKIDKKQDLEYICEEFTKMERSYPLTTSHHRGYLEITIIPSESKFFNEVVTLLFTHKKGYIFKMQNGLNYKNDDLADFLIKKMEITKLYSDTICE